MTSYVAALDHEQTGKQLLVDWLVLNATSALLCRSSRSVFIGGEEARVPRTNDIPIQSRPLMPLFLIVIYIHFVLLKFS